MSQPIAFLVFGWDSWKLLCRHMLRRNCADVDGGRAKRWPQNIRSEISQQVLDAYFSNFKLKLREAVKINQAVIFGNYSEISKPLFRNFPTIRNW